jgi:hypothetical protein
LDESPDDIEVAQIAWRVRHNESRLEVDGHRVRFGPTSIERPGREVRRKDDVHAAVGMDVGELPPSRRFGGVDG